MSTSPVRFPHLLYDAQETLEAFQCRQRHAYQAGKQAWRAGLINGQTLQLYEELVRFVGANRFCWVKEETLASRLTRSASTLKRWMSQLIATGLIRRDRRFGQSSLTFITAYAQAEPDVSDHASQHVLADTHRVPTDDLPTHGSIDSDKAPQQPSSAMLEPAHVLAHQAPTPYGELKHEPTFSSFVLPHTLKDHHVTSWGGGCIRTQHSTDDVEARSDTTLRLQHEGVNDPIVLQELSEHPVAEVEQVIRYVARCRSTDDPRRPGLIVHLVRRGFGSGYRRQPVGDATKAIPRKAAGADVRSLPPDSPDSGTADTALRTSWLQTLNLLRHQLDLDVYQTWIAQNQLLVVEDDCAVVGTPNIFVREEVEQHYAAHIEAALSESYGRPMRLQVVIGTTILS